MPISARCLPSSGVTVDTSFHPKYCRIKHLKKININMS